MFDFAQVFTWLVTVVCLAGTILNVKRCPWCFVLWIIGNVAWAAFDLFSGLYSRMVLDIVQLGLAVWGLVEWSANDNVRCVR